VKSLGEMNLVEEAKPKLRAVLNFAPEQNYGITVAKKCHKRFECRF